ncbi:MerR family transcriptional regulator [Actinokineospora guangxiensis]|uniref:MerR family transcriptional regulator n=1 Tax=Actinokineospora guangxiensis TaxID=1490288 RepID=A0ABW0EWC4_9PSEU
MDGRTTAERTWTAGQVAARLRIAESTLRAWHRRYGVGPHPARPGQYRRYSADDVVRLARMGELIAAGMPAADAATAIAEAGPPVDEVLAAVVRAARALDTSECVRHLGQALTRWGVVRAWAEVCLPALAAMDDDQRGDTDCIACEHALTWAVTAVLHTVPRPPAAAPAIMLSCVEAERHSLGLEALAAALAEQDVPTRMLGASMPTAALAHAVRTSQVDTLVLWAQHPGTARADTVRSMTRLTRRVVLAGPGWRRPLTRADRVTSLAEALDSLRVT